MQHQHSGQPAGIIFIVRFMDCFLHQTSIVTGNWCYDRHRPVRLVVCFFLAIDQIAQSGLSSLKVIYYLAQLFRPFDMVVSQYRCTGLTLYRILCKRLFSEVTS